MACPVPLSAAAMDSPPKLRVSKPLNPKAESFFPRWLSKNSEKNQGEHKQPGRDRVPASPEMWYPPFYSHSHFMFVPDLKGMVTAYPLRSTPCQKPGSGFYDANLHHRKMDEGGERIVAKKPRLMYVGRRRMVDPVPKRVTKWRVKIDNKKSTGNTGVRPVIPFPKTLEEVEYSGITTTMIRNIPNHFRHEDLVDILDGHCYKENVSADSDDVMSKYDFVYLPMDYRRRVYENRTTNLGYAFVNFTTCKAAFKFYEYYHGYKWRVTKSGKICEIAIAAFQGKDELKKKLQKIFRCPCCKYLPVEYFPPRDGLNRRMEGSKVGKFVRGLPRTILGS